MSVATSMFVANVGMSTCVGGDADSSCAAFRCRISGFRELPYQDIRNVPLIGAPVGHIASSKRGIQRLIDLSLPALEQSISTLNLAQTKRSTLVLVLGDSGDADTNAAMATELRSGLLRKSGLEFAHPSKDFFGGACTAIDALVYARALLASGEAEHCVIGAVDSMIDMKRLRTLERERRLRRRNDPDGLIPGEAAVFVLCSRGQPNDTVCVHVDGLSCIEEEAGRRAGAISKACRAALAEGQRRVGDIATLVSDLSGERDGAIEYSIALTRVFSEPRETLTCWHPAMSIGSVGAASLFVGLAWILCSARRGYAAGLHALCVSLSDSARRGACAVSISS